MTVPKLGSGSPFTSPTSTPPLSPRNQGYQGQELTISPNQIISQQTSPSSVEALLDAFSKMSLEKKMQVIFEANGIIAFMTTLCQNTLQIENKDSKGPLESFLKAVEEGNVEKINVFLQSPNIDFILNQQTSDWKEWMHRHSAMIRLLIADSKINPHKSLIEKISTICTEWALENGPEDVLLLLKNPHYVPDMSLIDWAIENKHLAVIEQIIENSNLPYGTEFLKIACHKGFTDVVEILLKSSKVDIHADEHIAFKLACGNGHAACVKKLIDKGVDPSTENNYGILYAENAEVASLLLSYPQVNPHPDNPHGIDALILASIHGKLDVVKVLLKDKRVDPTVLMGACACWAYGKNHMNVVDVLLGDERINPHGHVYYQDWFNDPSRVKDYMLGDLERVERIPDYIVVEVGLPEDVIEKKGQEQLFLEAIKKGDVVQVRAFLENPNFDPTPDHTDGQDALILASKHGKLDVVIELLKDKRLDPMASVGECVVQAHKKGHSDVVKVLLEDPRVNPEGYANYKDWFDDLLYS